jgi:hypothetical protein
LINSLFLQEQAYQVLPHFEKLHHFYFSFVSGFYQQPSWQQGGYGYKIGIGEAVTSGSTAATTNTRKK